VRLVDEILNQLDWNQWEAAYKSTKGRPPIHPSIIAKVLLFAMVRRVRSSRVIEYELKHSIDFMWLTSGRTIDHTTLSEFRRKYTVELKGLFTQMVKLAIDLKVANLAALCIDGTRGPAQIPKTDPDSRILPNKEGGYAANFTPMAVTETTGGLIVDCEVMIGNVEHDQLGTIIEAVGANFDVDIDRVLADSAYTTGKNLALAEEKEVELLGPQAETNRKDCPVTREDPSEPVAEEDLDRLPIKPQTKCFDKSAFVYDEDADCYYCPAGKPLEHRTTTNTTRSCGTAVQRKVYTCQDCAGCVLADRCRQNPEAKRGREVSDDQYEGARRRHRKRMKSAEAQAAYSVRHHTGEVPFAVIKTMFDLRRFLLRGIEGVGQEWRWAATAFNLKKLMRSWTELRTELPFSVATS
jgi:transposase